jgi:single-strand DNA-binding protein
MSGVNKVILLGRLGKDPESRQAANQNVCNFSMATSEKYKDKASGETKETTEWHNVVAWGSLADIITRYVHKGDNIYIEGKLKTRSWEKDGVTRYTTEVLASNIVLLGNKPQGQSNQAPPQSAAPQEQTYSNAYVDDLPF